MVNRASRRSGRGDGTNSAAARPESFRYRPSATGELREFLYCHFTDNVKLLMLAPVMRASLQ